MKTQKGYLGWFGILACTLLFGCVGLRNTESLQPAVDPSVMETKKEYPITADPELRTRLEKLATALEGKRQEFHIPGMALAVVKDDEIIFTRGLGLADLEKHVPVSPQTIFAIGSASKAFTCALVGMLVQEGKMGWDDPITQYLPYLELPVSGKQEGDEVSIRDLLCHRTGFTRMPILWANGTVPREEILRDALAAEPWAPFREGFLYNNVMYLAAGVASAKAVNSDWDTLLQERLLNPLGMSDSTPLYESAQRAPRLSLGYRWDEEKGEYERLPMRNLDNIAPAGAINSHVLDMAQWIRFQLGNGVYEGHRLISEQQLSETRKAQIELAPNFHYGLGWFLQEWRGQPVVQHGGNIDGFSSMVALLPESNLGFVLLANVTSTPLQHLSINMVWEHLIDTTEPKSSAAAAGETESYEPYLGEYIANFGQFKDTIFTVQVQNEQLAVDVPGQTIYQLKAPDEQGKRYFAITDTVAVSFERNQAGEVILMRMHQAGFDFEILRKGVPIVPEIDESELWKYLGIYHSEKWKADVEVLIQNHRLTLDVPGPMNFELHLPDESGHRHFRIRADRSVTFNESEDGQVESVTYYRAGEIAEVIPRVDSKENPLMTLKEIHRLRGTEQRRSTLREFGSFRMQGTIRFAQAGVSGKTIFSSQGSKRFRQDMELGKYGYIRTIVTPEQAATEQSFAPFQEHRGKYLEQAHKTYPAMTFGDWSEFYGTIEVIRAGEFEGRPVHLVKLAGGKTPATTLYVDSQSGDVVKQESTLLVDGLGSIPVINLFEDFREVKGLRIPFRLISSNDQNGKTIIQFNRIETQIELDSSFFAIETP